VVPDEDDEPLARTSNVASDAARDDIALAGTIASVGTEESTVWGDIASVEASKRWRHAKDRYELRETIGVGAQGEVLRALDRVLDREVAIKALRDRQGIDPSGAQRFIAEARITARIAHPNIVPIYDAGRLDDGRPFYAMPLLPHRTLSEALERDRPPLVRVMRWFIGACMGVHAAHEVGVIHRDLKPANLLIGPAGELLVTDFGLARLMNQPSVVSTHTVPGQPIGTPQYMSPEQARGAKVGAPTDVYALGAILYEILTQTPPIREATLTEQLIAILEKTPAPPEQLASDVPVDLAALAMSCLAKEPEARPPTALALVDQVEGWLDGRFEGERRREEHERRLAEASEHRSAAEALSRTTERLREALRDEQRATPAHAPLDEKERLWLLEEDLERLVGERDDHEHAAVAALEAALRAYPEGAAARERLVSLLLMRKERHERRGNRALARREGMKAVAIGGDAVRTRLFALGHVVIASPLATPFRCERFEPRAGRLVAVDAGIVEPGRARELAPGSYRATVPDGDVTLPFVVEAGRRLVLELDPAPQAALPEGMVLIAGGPTLIGGDAEDGVRARTVDVASFAVARSPVSCGEYLAYLRTAFDDPEAALLAGPRASASEGAYWRLVNGRVAIPEEDADGDAWDASFPVFGISALDAERYLAWRSGMEEVRYRLLRDEEWERACRGADGRRYPWGDRFDPALCKMRSSREGDFAPEPIGAFETDVSPFGVLDMAGGVAEWTASPYQDDPRFRSVRGGGWSTRAHRCAATFRGSMIEDHVSADLGFRLAMDV